MSEWEQGLLAINTFAQGFAVTYMLRLLHRFKRTVLVPTCSVEILLSQLARCCPRSDVDGAFSLRALLGSRILAIFKTFFSRTILEMLLIAVSRQD